MKTTSTRLHRATASVLGLALGLDILAPAPRPPQLQSPLVHSDRKVTFNFRAPNAKKVELSAQFSTGNQPLTADTNGVWSITVGPVEPNFYPNNFVVDGVSVADPGNQDLFPNERFKASIVGIPGGQPSLHSAHDVPHGEMSYGFYQSKTLGRIRETRPCEVYVSASLDGPWERLGTITVEDDPKRHASNVSIMARPDGNFEFVPRDGRIFYSDQGILGPYKPQGGSVFPKEMPNLEDPCIWYSGGLDHIVVNSWSTRVAYHLTSRGGIRDWTNRGAAYDPREAIVLYPDGTVNHWNKAERPSVYLENGRVAAMTLPIARLRIDVGTEHENRSKSQYETSSWIGFRSC